MSEVTAKVIEHSCFDGEFYTEELITVEVDFHRFILPELNTHRVFSRNYQSSRAVPVLRQLQQIIEDPALPVYWGKNQRGMVAEEELEPHLIQECKDDILMLRDMAVAVAKRLEKRGLHKQTANRYVEPWMWTKGVITATRKGWDSFFALRIHPDAQPEIKLLAERIYEAIEASVPRVLKEGDYHLPYVDQTNTDLSIEDMIKVSVSCCAQVSYRSLDDSLEKAKRIYSLLNLPEGGVFKDDPAHMSPTEHVAVIPSFIDGSFNSNFNSSCFLQYRKFLEDGSEEYFYKQQKDNK